MTAFLLALLNRVFFSHLIKENGKLSGSLITEKMLSTVGIADPVKRAENDKSELFEYERGKICIGFGDSQNVQH